MARTRGQAKSTNRKTSTKPDKNKNEEIKTRKMKVLLERLDPSQYSSIESLDHQSEKENSVKVAKESEKEPEIESEGRRRATRSVLRGKDTESREKTATENSKQDQMVAASKPPQVIEKRVTRGSKISTEEPKQTKVQAKKKKTEEKVSVPRSTRAGSKLAIEVPSKSSVGGNEEISKLKELTVRIRKISISSYKQVDENPLPKKRGRPQSPQKFVSDAVSDVELQASPAPNDRNSKMTSNVKFPATKDFKIRVRKMLSSEYQGLKEQTIEQGRSKTSEVAKDDKLGESSSPIEILESVAPKRITRLTNKKVPEASKLKSATATSQKGESSKASAVLGEKTRKEKKDAEIPRRKTRGNIIHTQAKEVEAPKKVVVNPAVKSQKPEKVAQIAKTKKNDVTPKTTKQSARVVQEHEVPSAEPQKQTKDDQKSPLSHEVKAPSTSPSTSLRIIDNPDEHEDDPYSFEASQTDNNSKQKQTKKPKKRPQAKVKPGNKMELLMHKETLDAAGYSLFAQNNPLKYNDEVVQVEKQINVPGPSIPKVAIADNRSKEVVSQTKQAVVESSKKPTVTMQKSLPSLTRQVASPVPLRPSTSAPSTIRPFHSKVWHSPPVTTVTKISVIAEETSYAAPFISDSPPIQSSFARQMASQRFNARASAPFRVTGNLPSAFYMGLSSNDGTPSYSSDAQHDENAGENSGEVKKRKSNETSWNESNDEKQRSNQENNENQLKKKRQNISENMPLPSNHRSRSTASFLDDSNAENMEPPGFMKSPAKRKGFDPFNRSPLKALAISKLPDGDMSSISIFNTTMEQSIPVPLKKVNVVEKIVNESLDILGMCERAQEESETRQEVHEKSESRDAFGFDELLGADRQMPSTSSVSLTDTREDIREKLENMKKYLPSKQCKNRDKNMFPTTPVKHSDVFRAPNESGHGSIRKFMSSSTPLGNTLKVTKSSFGDVSRIEETNETDVTEIDGSEVDATNIELFGDQSELYNAQRSYTRRKRIPEFLTRVEETESESDGNEEIKAPTKTKRKKPNIEQTRDFKRFVNDKSTEFAEVDDYKMIID